MGKVLHLQPGKRPSHRSKSSASGAVGAVAAGPPSSMRIARLADPTWWRPAALLAILVLLWFRADSPLAGLQMEMLPRDAELVDARFDRCGEGNPYCVVDGDTIRIGDRRIRLVGFDTPEKNSRCEAERLGAARATVALQDWLNRGPFMMSVGAGDRAVDRYGRDLRMLVRDQASGLSEYASAYMVESGFGRIYNGGQRAGWC